MGSLKRHGYAGRGKRTPEYNVWISMRRRCMCETDKSYPDYGGRGITICRRWDSFPAFLEDMGKRPSLDHSIDRIDNNAGYYPGNCRWATRSQQQKNKRPPTRKVSGKRVSIKREACKRGHPFKEGNVYITPSGDRNCMTCRREAVRRYQAKSKQPSAAGVSA